MQGKSATAFGGLFVVCAVGMSAAPLHAQSTEVKEKPAMYSYVANWQMPRAKWAEFEKPSPGGDKVLSQALGSGALVGYGADKVEVHSAEGPTHDSFWSAMSMGAVLDVLDSLGKGPPIRCSKPLPNTGMASTSATSITGSPAPTRMPTPTPRTTN